MLEFYRLFLIFFKLFSMRSRGVFPRAVNSLWRSISSSIKSFAKASDALFWRCRSTSKTSCPMLAKTSSLCALISLASILRARRLTSFSLALFSARRVSAAFLRRRLDDRARSASMARCDAPRRDSMSSSSCSSASSLSLASSSPPLKKAFAFAFGIFEFLTDP